MIRIKGIGEFESVPQVVKDIIDCNVTALEEHLATEWNLNEPILLGKYTRLTPLNLALIMNNFESVK